MQYRELGATGIRVSLLGLGTVKFGRTEALPYPVAALPSRQALHELLSAARDLGINLLDTAPAYGSSEMRLGELLLGERDAWIVCTKVGEVFEGGRSTYDFSPEHARFSVLRSLQRLQTDRLDVVLVHSDGDDDAIIRRYGTLDALAAMKQQGLLRAYGISHKTVAGGLLAVERCDVVMAALSASRRDELDVIRRAGAQRCGVLIKKALDSGRSADPARLRESLRFVANTAGVSSIVIGTTNAAHLRANATALHESD